MGERLVLFDRRPGTHLVTSRVRRVFEAGSVLYVQTRNSVYRVALVSGELVTDDLESLQAFAEPRDP